MPSKVGDARNTRELFDTSHGAGKGSAPRPVDQKVFRENISQIKKDRGTYGKPVKKSASKTTYTYK